MFKKTIIVLFIILAMSQFSFAAELSKELSYEELKPEEGWKAVIEGVEVKEIALRRQNWYGMGLTKEDLKGESISVDEIQKVNIKALRIDPKKLKLRLIYCYDYGEKSGADIKTLVKKSGAIGAITGGFYDYGKDRKGFKPVGILIVDGQKIAKWMAGVNGIFIVNQDGATDIIDKGKYKYSPDILQAVQSGPILVNDGGIKIDKPSSFNEFKILPRTAVGITKDKKIIMVAGETGYNGLSLYELAEIMKRLESDKALNMDGGPSAQMYLATKKTELYVKGAGKIIDAIGFFAK
ncbi:MAG: hypothetical protein A2042_06750 [Candidatus Schekmanbacteria bacterium GWA2_38_11]|uniref:Phosphodiester glycosidase domain-containing protein n=2 Tax=Bacteria candidate phyla TaxID=1783234 RepID=A0A1F7RKX5_9BACT|nr:MAG: hypothetical protein UT63_C0032G0005 [Candidatus Gottesmanbacteria bacterium GW2011_GWC2_39_8]OGL42219.1 MAG: hypothetical protein A2042_06750 [Candidatus Schekmanbacteria bacterium GWA2_38_11]